MPSSSSPACCTTSPARRRSPGSRTTGPREHHGEAGARWLTPRVGARVAWLAEQHVPAKRYLVATDPDYRAQLSEVSQRTLIAQGGAMSEAEVAAFRANPDWQQAVQLRLIDDLGKVPGLEVPDIDSYRTELATVVAATLALMTRARATRSHGTGRGTHSHASSTSTPRSTTHELDAIWRRSWLFAGFSIQARAPGRLLPLRPRRRLDPLCATRAASCTRCTTPAATAACRSATLRRAAPSAGSVPITNGATRSTARCSAPAGWSANST